MSNRHAHGHALRKGRFSVPSGIYLVTTVCQDRRPLFTDFNTARLVVSGLRSLQQAERAETLCYVVMPDHLHWLMSLIGSEDLSHLVQSMKSYTGRRINALRGGFGPVWQKGFHDHALRADEDLPALARYVVANPLRAGLVARMGDYPFWDAMWL